jgi:hypothetical protein
MKEETTVTEDSKVDGVQEGGSTSLTNKKMAFSSES